MDLPKTLYTQAPITHSQPGRKVNNEENQFLENAVRTLHLAHCVRRSACCGIRSLAAVAGLRRWCNTATRTRQPRGASGEQTVPRRSRSRNSELHLLTHTRGYQVCSLHTAGHPVRRQLWHPNHDPLLQPQPG